MRLTCSTRMIIFLGIAIFLILSIVSSTIGIKNPKFFLNENQILYLFSTTAQVIAAIYGLTLTGFLFFRNELTREATEDETLAEAIEKIKSRYFKLLVFITILVGITLLLSNIVISHETSPDIYITSVLINVGQSAFAVSFTAITLFIFDVIAPQRIESASQNLQDELDPKRSSSIKGDISDFLRNYNQIELILNEFGQTYQPLTSNNQDSKWPRRISNSRLVDILLKSERIDMELYKKLRELITLRNAIIHGAEPIVSQKLVVESADALQNLRIALNI